jgi:hypothetical protein
MSKSDPHLIVSRQKVANDAGVHKAMLLRKSSVMRHHQLDFARSRSYILNTECVRITRCRSKLARTRS